MEKLPVIDGCMSFKIGACDEDGTPSQIKKHDPLIHVNVDGECCLTTPASFEFFPDQITVRGSKVIPNERTHRRKCRRNGGVFPRCYHH